MTKDEMMQQKKITTAGNPAKPTGEAGEKMLARMNEGHDMHGDYYQGTFEPKDKGKDKE